MNPRPFFRPLVTILLFGLMSCAPILATGKTNAQPDRSVFTTAGTNGATSGANTAFTGVTNNFLNHQDKAERDKLRARKQAGEELTPEENRRLVILEADDQLSDGLLERFRRGETLNDYELSDLKIYLTRYFLVEGKQATQDLLKNGPTPDYDYPYAGSKEMTKAYMDNLAKERDVHWLVSLLMFRERTPNEEAYLEARTQSGLFWNTAPNESFYPSVAGTQRFFNEIDAITNSALATTGFLGATIAGANPDTRYNLTMSLSQVSDIVGSFMLSKVGLGSAFGETKIQAKPENVAKGGAAPNLNINVGQQNKHIVGTNEFKTAGQEIPRSPLAEGIDPQALVNQYAGTGQAINKVPLGQPGSVERISTNQIIGTYYDNGTPVGSTTNFTIRYAKDGVHIVPARP